MKRLILAAAHDDTSMARGGFLVACIWVGTLALGAAHHDFLHTLASIGAWASLLPVAFVATVLCVMIGKRLGLATILAAALLTPLAAHAQPAPDPNTQALGQEVMECVSAKVAFRAATIAAAAHETAAVAAAVAKQKAEDEAAARKAPETKQ